MLISCIQVVGMDGGGNVPQIKMFSNENGGQDEESIYMFLYRCDT